MAKQIDPAADRVTEAGLAPPELEPLYRALTAGDVVAARSLLTEDAILRVPGRSQIAGRYLGPQAIAGYFASLKERSENTATISVDGWTRALGKAVVLQKVTARRDGQKFEDEQTVVLELQNERVTEAVLYPYDLRTHDAFWGRNPLLTTEDRDLLAAAIRAGSSPPPDRNVTRKIVAGFIVATVALVGSFLAFDWLDAHYPSQKLFATTTDLSSVDHVVIADRDDGGSWSLEPAMVERVSVVNPLGEVRVSLPVPRSKCDELARNLRTSCSAGTIPVEAPFDMGWSKPARLIGSTKQASRLDLELVNPSGDRRISGMSLVTSSLGSPSLCFTEPPQRGSLLLTDADGTQVPVEVKPHIPPVGCDNGVILSIGDRLAQENVTSIALDGLAEVRFDAAGTLSDLDGLAGRLAVVNVETHLFDSAAHVVARATASNPTEIGFDIDEVEGRLTMSSDEVTSVLTDDGELLPTQWERLPGWVVALFGSIVTAVVVPALMALVQLFRDWFFLRP